MVGSEVAAVVEEAEGEAAPVVLPEAPEVRQAVPGPEALLLVAPAVRVRQVVQVALGQDFPDQKDRRPSLTGLVVRVLVPVF